VTPPWGELAALGCAALWATTAILFTAAGRHAPPVATNLFKTVAASLLFALVAWALRGNPWPTDVSGPDFGLLVLSGLAGLTLADSCLLLGFQVVGTRVSNLLMSGAPILGALGGWILLDEHLSARGWGGMAVALSGLALVMSDRGSRVGLRGRRLLWGLLLGLGAASGQAAGAILAKPALERVPTLEVTQIRVGTGAAGLLLYGLLRRDLGLWGRTLFLRPVLWRLILASILGPFAGIWLMVTALDRIPTGITMTLIGTSPLWLLPLGAWLQRDPPSAREILGAVVAVTGVAILLLR